MAEGYHGGTLAAVIVPARYNGPPDSGNGGYTCGLVAAELGATSAEVTPEGPAAARDRDDGGA